VDLGFDIEMREKERTARKSWRANDVGFEREKEKEWKTRK
jgi:hypothetical protein